MPYPPLPRAGGPRAPSLPGPFARRLVAIVLAVSFATGPVACARHGSTPLRIGMNAEPGYEFAYLAQVRGMFEREGVKVELVQFSDMSDSRRAFERGQVDGFFGTVFEVLQARADGDRSPRIVRIVDRSLGFDVVLARPSHPRIDSLRGRRIAVEPGSLNTYLLARALERHGMGLGDVTLVGMPPAEMPAALRAGGVDAVVTYPPVATSIQREGLARPVFSSAEIPSEIVDLLAVDESVLRSRSRDVAAFLRAYDAAVAWMTAHSDEACAIMAAREGLTKEEFRGSLSQGLELVSASSQQGYFVPGGLLDHVVRATSGVLLATGRISTPIEPEDVLPSAETKAP